MLHTGYPGLGTQGPLHTEPGGSSIEGTAAKAGLRPVVLVNPSLPVRRVLEIALPNGMDGLEVRVEEA